MIMPFGQYKGEELLDIPTEYLEWLYENVELYGDLEQEVSDVLSEKSDNWPF